MADVVMASTTHLAHTTTLHCNLSGCDNIPLHIGQGSKPVTEMTCVGANAGSFLPHMHDRWRCYGVYMMRKSTWRDAW